LFPESRRSEKVWPFFKELAIELNKFSQWKVIIAGNHKDNRFHNCVDMRESITLSDLPSIINKASLIICNDSAPLHIASALRKKLVALFGPTEAVRYGPYPTNHQNNIIIRSSTGRMEDIKLTSVLNGIECLLE
jgi:ADP-heptose:LPS heptosyltransferase